MSLSIDQNMRIPREIHTPTTNMVTLISLIRTNNINGVREFLDRNHVDINNKESTHIYMIPSLITSVPMLRMLVNDYGLDMSYLSPSGNNMLTMTDIPSIISDMIVSMNVDVNYRNNKGMTPLFYHLQGDHYKEDVVNALVQNGADVNIPSNNGVYPLHIALTPNIINILLRGGADPNVLISLGRAVPGLMIACTNLPTMMMMVEHGLDVNLRSKQTGRTILHYAIDENVFSVIQYLVIEAGADVNAIERINGDTPLTIAVRKKDSSSKRKVVELLLDYGANVHHRNYYRMSAYNYATDNDESMRSLISRYMPTLFSSTPLTPSSSRYMDSTYTHTI